MEQSVRAVYQNGQLRLLDPVKLKEGEEIELTIRTQRDKVVKALGDLVASSPATMDDDDVDESAITRELDEAFRGQLPLSQTIVDERQESP